jgi:hypothetical protein
VPTRVLRELSRRRVFRGAGTYVVVAWLALRFVDAVTDPTDPARRLALMWAIGLFPLAVLFSWVFQVTPAAIEREDHGAPHPPKSRFGHALDVGVAAGVVVVVLGEILRRAL